MQPNCLEVIKDCLNITFITNIKRRKMALKQSTNLRGCFHKCKCTKFDKPFVCVKIDKDWLFISNQCFSCTIFSKLCGKLKAKLCNVVIKISVQFDINNQSWLIFVKCNPYIDILHLECDII